jgi:glycosyltransferase involved in cell wall biosynthesis
MKVLIIGSKEYPFNSSKGFDRYAGGGIEKHVEKLSKYLAKESHEPVIITRRFPGQKDYEQKGGVKVYRTGFFSNKYLRNFSYNIRAYGLAKKIIRDEKIDLIHAHAVVAGFFGARLSKKTGVPMVFTPHGSVIGWKFPVKQILKQMESYALKYAEKVLFISPAEKKEMECKTKSSALLTNGIDLDDFVPGRRMWKPVRFLFMGRLLKFKGIIHSIEAFETLVKEFPDAEFFVAGDGEARKEVEAFARRDSRIHYLGWVSETEDLLKKVDVFVLPSTEKGQPVALLEAMASEKIIMTSLGFIKDGKTGISVTQNIEDLRRKMLHVCRNFDKLHVLGRNARKDIEEDYSWSKVVRMFLREYETVVK